MSSVLIRCSKRLLLTDFFITAAAATSSPPLQKISAGHIWIGGCHGYGWKRPCASAQFLSTATSSVSPSDLSATVAAREGGGNSQGNTIKVTDKCKERLRAILVDKGTFLRVSVEGGGCSGFQYKFEIDSQLGDDDIVIAKETRKRKDGSDFGLKEDAPALVVIDQTSLDLIQGSTLDYETELIRSTFRVVNNPLAEQGCSCGASFNMKI